jgi:hypothetical protein
MEQVMRLGVASGQEPAEVAQIVLAAIRAGRFWVLPYEGSADRARAEAATRYGDVNPVFMPILPADVPAADVAPRAR